MIFDQLYKLDFIFCSQFVEENSFKAAFCEGYLDKNWLTVFECLARFEALLITSCFEFNEKNNYAE